MITKLAFSATFSAMAPSFAVNLPNMVWSFERQDLWRIWPMIGVSDVWGHSSPIEASQTLRPDRPDVNSDMINFKDSFNSHNPFVAPSRIPLTHG